MREITRRQICIGAVAAGVLLAAPKTLCASTPKVEVGRPTYKLIQASDPTFELLVDEHFPGLLKKRRWKKVKKAAVLLVNTSTVPLYGCELSWRAAEASGEVKSYSRRFVRRPSLHLVKRKKTATEPFVSAGGVALISPLFFWPADVYQTKPGLFRLTRKQFKSYAVRSPRARTFLRRLGSIEALRVRVRGVVLQDAIFGHSTLRLAKTVRNQQNAEHDEACTLLQTITESGVSMTAGSISAIAKLSAVGHLQGRELLRHKAYALGRSRFATKVAFAAAVMTPSALQQALQEVAGTPRSVYFSRSSGKGVRS